MIRIVLPLFSLFILIQANAQTKTIAYKRHGGDRAANSSIRFFDRIEESNSNFGNYPGMELSPLPILSKIIYLNDTTAVVVTEPSPRNLFLKDSSEWSTIASDTFVNHPLFSKGLDVDSMRLLLPQYFNYYERKEVKFENFKTTKEVKKEVNEMHDKRQKQMLKNEPEIKKNSLLPIFRYSLLTLLFTSLLALGYVKVNS